ncbi:hypothetical protein KSC_005940 [Ktedonobacter sp. SOSP1-52]|uniref:response regulator transcription factor n=1 Tax=Ktedonobacter sp. SOSP1-52 TaxID=2778366 RepID=UPI001916C4AE|nr:response regulator transcription factor [Ktedonobacter sp. SOSP1-52]GHO61702.1 hypothetical protein KSC_005940 [Ktedonobacter sp. SOSP1-52]
MHIAVIDEADLIQDMLRSVLELSGHQVEIYHTMPDQIAQYDLVIVEPGEDGQEFMRLLPLLRSHALPILILTFHEENLTLARLHLLPALWKMPFRLSSLLATIEQFGSQGRQHQKHDVCFPRQMESFRKEPQPLLQAVPARSKQAM